MPCPAIPGSLWRQTRGRYRSADVRGHLGQRRAPSRHDHVPGRKRPRHLDRQALPRELVDHHQDPKLPAVLRSLGHEVVAPHMVAMHCLVTGAGVGAHARQSAAFPLLTPNLHVLLLPDPVHPLDVHPPAPKSLRAGQDAMRALAPVPRERFDDLPHHRQEFTVAVDLPWTVTLRAPVLAEHPTDPSFRDLFMPQVPPDGFHRPTATLGAGQLSCATQACGRAASFRISMSRADRKSTRLNSSHSSVSRMPSSA